MTSHAPLIHAKEPTMERVLVTGGAGFIGSHLVERLLSEGRRVYCLDNFDPFYSPAVKWNNIEGATSSPLCTLVDADIRDRGRVERLFETEQIDAVIHLAARAGVRPSLEQPALYHDINLGGTVALLETIRRHSIRNFLFASSSSVYGDAGRVPFREDDPVDQPVSPYAATKRAGELLCYTYHHLYGLPVTCLRFFTAYGPRQRPDLAIHTFARHLLAGEPIPMFGDGSTARDYTFVEDIVDGIVAALDRPQPYEIINLGSSRPVSLREMIETMEEVFGRRAHLNRLPRQPGDVTVTCADTSKAWRLLGYEPRLPFREGMERFRDWLLRTQAVAHHREPVGAGRSES
jgi:UDP-glucuronate 4-epimerase